MITSVMSEYVSDLAFSTSACHLEVPDNIPNSSFSATNQSDIDSNNTSPIILDKQKDSSFMEIRFAIRLKAPSGLRRVKSVPIVFNPGLLESMTISLENEEGQFLPITITRPMISVLSSRGYFELQLEEETIAFERVFDPFYLAIHGSKFAATSQEEIEEASLEFQTKRIEGSS